MDMTAAKNQSLYIYISMKLASKQGDEMTEIQNLGK